MIPRLRCYSPGSLLTNYGSEVNPQRKEGRYVQISVKAKTKNNDKWKAAGWKLGDFYIGFVSTVAPIV
jgi:hypothetical protein